MKNQQFDEEERRFQFGENWKDFLSHIDESRIVESDKSLKDFLEVEDLTGKSFIDVGSGSGLSSLSARRLGAEILSFDYDPHSVACTKELRHKYFPGDDQWEVMQGSILDKEFVDTLGTFDICYSWGVLHHTGALWDALNQVDSLVKPGGQLYVALYNDEGWISSVWYAIKKMYNTHIVLKLVLTIIMFSVFFLAGLFSDLCRFKNPINRFKDHKKLRGMSLVHDWKDWLGGFPYEVSSPEKVNSFFEEKNYKLINFKKPIYGFGCNYYLFRKK